MTNKINIILLSTFFVQLCLCAKIPPYFTQCSKSDPKLNECIAHNANGGLYAFVKGDKTYNIQSMLPIFIPHINLQVDKHLKINITNAVISDLEGAKIKRAKVKLNDNQIDLTMYMPRATLIGEYHIKGKISILPIDEMGPVNITVFHSKVKYSFYYDLLEKKDHQYMNITSSAMTYKSDRAFFKFYNLFPEHEFLGDVINKSLNDNWFVTNDELSPVISNAICKITTKSIQGFFDKVPYDELLSE